MNYNILIGGAAGQGMATISGLLEKILKRKGYHIFSSNDYMSRVRGGHNFVQIRFGTEPITSHHPDLDLIIALNHDAVDIHSKHLKRLGAIICDTNIDVKDNNILRIPMMEIAKDLKNPKVFGSVALGVVLRFFGFNLDGVQKVLEERFNVEVSNANFEAFKMGYELSEKKFDIDESHIDTNQYILINGNQGIALGALAGGVTFYSAYPMTPATGIMSYLSRNQREAGIIVEQSEDEIAAINMAIGASFAGARAMTGTSGGGFSLMVEGLGLAAISETPLVVVNVQRPGPATGLPTRTAQSDLGFMLTSSQDEFPRMIISLRDPEDAFYQTVRALNIAEKYQILVMLLSDQYLSDYKKTVRTYDLNNIKIERHLANENQLGEGRYKRYRLTENGISPRIIPGKFENQTVLGDSHEHNEYGFVDESNENRISMMNKRMKKMDLLLNEIQEPKYFGDESPEILILGWGSSHGSLKEAINILQEENISIGALVFGDLWPLPSKLLKHYTSKAKLILSIEHNYTGQLAKLIKQETGIDCNKSILRYDGRQLSGYEIYNHIKDEVL